jgi:hypothetical protein
LKPSQTTKGASWLSQFPLEDLEVAQLLIDSLEIHDNTTVINELRSQILRLIAREPERLPAVLVPIRSLEDLGEPSEGAVDHIAYETFDPGKDFPVLPGSEADIGSLSRGLIETNPVSLLSPTLGIDQLRDLRARTILLISDYSGSGRQATRFARAFSRNSTIASWISYGYIQVRVLVYAASSESAQVLAEEKNIVVSTVVPAKSAATAGWSKTQRSEIESLCARYVDDDELPRGYKQSFGLFSTNVRAPNNLPSILIRNGGAPYGLFPSRQVPPDFVREIHSYVPHPSLAQTLRNLGAADLALAVEEKSRPIRALRALCALQLLDNSIEESIVWGMLHLKPTEVSELKRTLLALGLIDLDSQTTKKGKRELLRARTRQVAPPRHVHTPMPEVTYVPTQLR